MCDAPNPLQILLPTPGAPPNIPGPQDHATTHRTLRPLAFLVLNRFRSSRKRRVGFFLRRKISEFSAKTARSARHTMGAFPLAVDFPVSFFLPAWERWPSRRRRRGPSSITPSIDFRIHPASVPNLKRCAFSLDPHLPSNANRLLIEYFFQCCNMAASTAKAVFSINVGSLISHGATIALEDGSAMGIAEEDVIWAFCRLLSGNWERWGSELAGGP
jgi:hypothetical protein